MNAGWHREEPREVRPFFTAVDAERALAASGIRLFDDDDFNYDTVDFDLDEIDFSKLSPVLQINVVDPDQWLPKALGLGELEVVLVASNTFLKRSEVIRRTKLNAKLPVEWVVEKATLDQLGGGRNLQLTLALCLSEDREPDPGSPFVVGHWLSRKTFAIRTRSAATLFDLRARTDEEWIAAGFPAKTMYSVDYIGGIDAELDDGASVATVYMHVDAQNRMISTSLGDSLQPLLAAEIILSIILDSKKEWENSTDVDNNSPLFKLMKQLGGDNPITVAELKDLTARPALMRARLQDRLSVLSALK
jgi:hypothetical protein